MPALVAFVTSLLLLFLGTKVALAKERRQILWAKEIDRFLALEELAGQLIEELGGYYHPISEDLSFLKGKFDALYQEAGRFARYPAVRQAIRDLHNVLGRMIDARNHHENDQSIRIELDPALRKLLDACDKAIGRKRLKRGGI